MVIGRHFELLIVRRKVEATFESYNPPKQLNIQNVFGMDAPEMSPGAIVFQVDGITHKLDTIAESGSEELFIIYRDKTSGKETYGMRYLYAPQPSKDNKLVVDFNKSTNPPCALTDFATCPVPPSQNRLTVAVEAGELKYGDH